MTVAPAGPAVLTVLALLALLAGLAVLAWPTAPRRSPHQDRGGPSPRRVTSRASLPAGRRMSTGTEVRRRATPLRDHLGRLRSRRAGTGEVEHVQLLDGLAAALEAGLSTEHALRVVMEPVDPTGSVGAWSELSRAAREGQPLAPSWARLARRTGSPTAASVARAWAVASATGAPLAAAVRSSAHAARERRRLERAVEVATAGARATATVLGLLPLAGLGLAALLGIGPVALYSDPLAMASAGLGLLLLAGGHWAVRRMVKGVLTGVTG